MISDIKIFVIVVAATTALVVTSAMLAQYNAPAWLIGVVTGIPTGIFTGFWLRHRRKLRSET